jgi:hypothetical protein
LLHHQGSGSVIIILVGGEIEAGNEDVWDNLLNKMAEIVMVPGPFVVGVRHIRFMGSRPESPIGVAPTVGHLALRKHSGRASPCRKPDLT